MSLEYKEINELDEATSLSADDYSIFDQSGLTKKASFANMVASLLPLVEGYLPTYYELDSFDYVTLPSTAMNQIIKLIMYNKIVELPDASAYEGMRLAFIGSDDNFTHIVDGGGTPLAFLFEEGQRFTVIADDSAWVVLEHDKIVSSGEIARNDSWGGGYIGTATIPYDNLNDSFLVGEKVNVVGGTWGFVVKDTGSILTLWCCGGTQGASFPNDAEIVGDISGAEAQVNMVAGSLNVNMVLYHGFNAPSVRLDGSVEVATPTGVESDWHGVYSQGHTSGGMQKNGIDLDNCYIVLGEDTILVMSPSGTGESISDYLWATTGVGKYRIRFKVL